MIKNLYILLFSLLTCSFFTSCDGDDNTLQDTILGRWYVNAVSHAGYNMYSGYDPIAEDYFINFFYGDYMPFLKGDQLEFGNFNMRRAGFNGTGDQYTYNIYRSTLELNNSYRVSYNILAWSHEQIILCFDKNSLLDYITSEMNYAQTAEHYQQLAYIRDQVIHYVSDFYIEYVLTRNIPTVSQIISGNYYGKLSDGSGPLFNNDWVSASLYRQGPESFNFVLNDQSASATARYKARLLPCKCPQPGSAMVTLRDRSSLRAAVSPTTMLTDESRYLSQASPSTAKPSI